MCVVYVYIFVCIYTCVAIRAHVRCLSRSNSTINFRQYLPVDQELTSWAIMHGQLTPNRNSPVFASQCWEYYYMLLSMPGWESKLKSLCGKHFTNRDSSPAPQILVLMSKISLMFKII